MIKTAEVIMFFLLWFGFCALNAYILNIEHYAYLMMYGFWAGTISIETPKHFMIGWRRG